MKGLARVLLGGVLVFLYAPILVMVAMAFNRSDLYALPFEPSLRWFEALAGNDRLIGAARNSVLVALVTAALSTAIGTLAALALGRRMVRGRTLLRLLLLPPIAIPWLITGTAMLVFFFWTGIGRGLHAMIIGHVALAIPYVVLVVGTGLAALRTDLEEAAISLGSTPIHAFWAITLPLLMPSLVAAALFAFAVSLDQFVVSYFLATPGVTTLPVEIYSAIRKGFTPEINAVSTILLGATVGLFVLFSVLTRQGRDPMSGVVVTGLSKAFGATPVLDCIDASFEAGRFTSLLGPSGSGKTTLLRIIGGFVAPDAGRVTIGGLDVTNEKLWKRRIGMVFQSYALFPHMTVAENVAYGLHRRGVRGAAARAEAGRALDLVRLTGFDDRRPKQLSGGQQQRVALARAIVTRPRVLLLDEPLSALDRRLRQEMQIELRRIQRESGLTTIFVTHDQEEALTLSDRVSILDRGRIVQSGEPAEVYERPASLFAATFLGEANLFAGVVRQGRVAIAGGVLRADGPMPPEGTAVTAAVRPEKMRLLAGDADPGEQNALRATVTQVVYAGATSTVLLAGQDGTAIRALVQNREAVPPAAGTAVLLAWSPATTILLRA